MLFAQGRPTLAQVALAPVMAVERHFMMVGEKVPGACILNHNTRRFPAIFESR